MGITDVICREFALSPELVGWVPTPKQFNSEAFFKEDTPMDAEPLKYMSEYNGPMTFVAHKHKIRGRRL